MRGGTGGAGLSGPGGRGGAGRGGGAGKVGQAGWVRCCRADQGRGVAWRDGMGRIGPRRAGRRVLAEV